MPDVRRYLSVFWGVIMMLIKPFDYLSDGCDPVVENLGVVLFLKFLDYFPRAGIENQGENSSKWV